MNRQREATGVHSCERPARELVLPLAFVVSDDAAGPNATGQAAATSACARAADPRRRTRSPSESRTE